MATITTKNLYLDKDRRGGVLFGAASASNGSIAIEFYGESQKTALHNLHEIMVRGLLDVLEHPEIGCITVYIHDTSISNEEFTNFIIEVGKHIIQLINK